MLSERSGWYCCVSGPHPGCERGWLSCYRSCIPVEGKENSWCMVSEAPGWVSVLSPWIVSSSRD